MKALRWLRLRWPPTRLLVVGAGRAVLGTAAGGRTADVEFDAAGLGAGDPDGLAAALKPVVRAASARRRPRLTVVLLPPLVDVRAVALPALRGAEARGALRENARRFFPSTTPQIVSCVPRPRTTAGVVACAAPEDAVLAILAGVERAGGSVEAVVAAPLLWAAEVADGWVVAAPPGRVEAVNGRGGSVAATRSFPEGTAPEEVAQAVHAEVRVVDPWAAALRAPGPALDAEIVPDRERRRRRRAEWRRVSVLVAATLAALCLAAGVHVWGLGRELDAIAARRREIAAPVDQVLRARDQLQRMDGRVAALTDAAATAPRWSQVIAALARSLPPDAHLTSLVGTGDSLALEGLAHDAPPVFEAVRGAAGVRSVRAAGPVRRELAANGQPAERFDLAVLLDGGEGL